MENVSVPYEQWARQYHANTPGSAGCRRNENPGIVEMIEDYIEQAKNAGAGSSPPRCDFSHARPRSLHASETIRINSMAYLGRCSPLG